MENDDIVVEIVYALPDAQQLVRMKLARGTCARAALKQALEQNRLVVNLPDAQSLPIGVYGEQVEDSYELKAEDRLEVYRPLLQDPKERRRLQARQAPVRKKPAV